MDGPRVGGRRGQRGRKPGYVCSEETREKIQVTKLVQRLEQDAFGEITLTTGQRDSIKILLAKSLPDLANLTISGDKENPISVSINLG